MGPGISIQNNSARSPPRWQDLRRPAVSFPPCFPPTATKVSAPPPFPLAGSSWATSGRNLGDIWAISGCCGGAAGRLPRFRRRRSAGCVCTSTPGRCGRPTTCGPPASPRASATQSGGVRCGQALPRAAPVRGRGPAAGHQAERTARTAAWPAANARVTAASPAPGRGNSRRDGAGQGSVGARQAGGNQAPPEGRPQGVGEGRAAADAAGCLTPPGALRNEKRRQATQGFQGTVADSVAERESWRKLCAAMILRQTFNFLVDGSNPSRPTMKNKELRSRKGTDHRCLFRLVPIRCLHFQR
ncbi:MAG: hypothetical protein GAK31_00921 [Stenotrophomonas maltophilia]|uniref:Uncharacterized protein n=1 Tax=Stenotrophomonas maltophilia TaxID=40324 RepID=A0A7V8JNH9_STEMA|nr:MAG: hypothetical protein GAK31_00921 [Stenotrophomonas maltophilia]